MSFLRNRPPILIILICIFELLGLFLLPSAFTNEKYVNFGLWYQFYLIFSGILSVAIIYTLWQMKKIAILIYIGSYTLHNIVALIVANWMIGVLIIPLIGLLFIALSRHNFK